LRKKANPLKRNYVTFDSMKANIITATCRVQKTVNELSHKNIFTGFDYQIALLITNKSLPQLFHNQQKKKQMDYDFRTRFTDNFFAFYNVVWLDGAASYNNMQFCVFFNFLSCCFKDSKIGFETNENKSGKRV
jgi:hypothetical protein